MKEKKSQGGKEEKSTLELLTPHLRFHLSHFAIFFFNGGIMKKTNRIG